MRVLRYFILFIMFITVVVFNLFFYKKETNSARELEQKYSYIQIRNMELISEWKKLSANSRIQEYAKTKLGMYVPGENDEVVYVKRDESSKGNKYVLLDYITPPLEALINN